MLKFLLHTCCAPCSVAVIEELKEKFDFTVFFYNPNIYPEEEYLKRKKYVVQICEEWGVKMVDVDRVSSPYEGGDRGGVGGEIDYSQLEWNEAVGGLENEPEGGARCSKCFRMRLEKTAQYAKEHGFDIFCTSLTSGRNKKAEVINPIGVELGKKYGVKFFEADWKKNGSPAFAPSGLRRSRQERANKLIKEKGIYRQNYCGCRHSLSSRAKRR